MNIIDLRKNLRDSSTYQRLSDRRINTSAYGSPEWLNYLNQNGFEHPTYDRRQASQRVSDTDSTADEAAPLERPYKRIFLTPAERKLLEDMYLGDLD